MKISLFDPKTIAEGSSLDEALVSQSKPEKLDASFMLDSDEKETTGLNITLKGMEDERQQEALEIELD